MNPTQPYRFLRVHAADLATIDPATDSFRTGWVRPYPIAGTLTVPRAGELHLREDGVHGQVWHFGVHLSEGRYMIVVLPDEPDDGPGESDEDALRIGGDDGDV